MSAVSGGMALGESGAGSAALDLSARDQAGLDQEFDERCDPFLVVAHAQIFGGGISSLW